MAPESRVQAVVSKAGGWAARLQVSNYCPARPQRQNWPVVEHFLTISSEACWGLYSLSEFEGLACAHCTMAHGMFDFPGSHLENILAADESYPKSHLCPLDVA